MICGVGADSDHDCRPDLAVQDEMSGMRGRDR